MVNSFEEALIQVSNTTKIVFSFNSGKSCNMYAGALNKHKKKNGINTLRLCEVHTFKMCSTRTEFAGGWCLSNVSSVTYDDVMINRFCKDKVHSLKNVIACDAFALQVVFIL